MRSIKFNLIAGLVALGVFVGIVVVSCVPPPPAVRLGPACVQQRTVVHHRTVTRCVRP